MSVASRWARFRARGPEQLAVTLGFFLAGFFLLASSKSVNNVYYALVLAPALVLLRRADWRWLAGSTIWRAALLLLAYLTASGLWSDPFALGDWLREAKGLPYLGVYLAVLACVCARRPATFERVLNATALAAVVGTVVSATVYYARTPWPARLEFAAAVYNANEAATIVGTTALLVLFHIRPASAAGWRRVFWGAGALVLLGGIALTGSRTPLAAALFCIGCGWALRRQWRVLLGFAVAVLAAGALLMNTDATRQALARGDSYRLAIWTQFAERVADQPWLGEGLLTDETTVVKATAVGADPVTFLHPHNVYLATTLYGGLPALALLLVMLALALREGQRRAARGEPAWLLLLLFALLCMLTDGDRLLNAPRAIWFYFWLPVGVLIAREAAVASPAAGHHPE